MRIQKAPEGYPEHTQRTEEKLRLQRKLGTASNLFPVLSSLASKGEAENKEQWPCAFPVQRLCQDPQELKNNLP